MIIVILCVLALILFVADSVHKHDYEHFIPMIICIVLLSLAGLFAPIQGFEEPVLVETKALYPLGPTESAIEAGSEKNDTYLIVKMSFKDDGDFLDTYKYCIVEDGTYKVVEMQNGRAKEFVIENQQPVIEKYQIKAKDGIWSFHIGADKTRYIIRVSPGMVKYDGFISSP